MSIAPREAKCSIRRRTCAGHCALTHRTATCAASFTTALPHSGQFLGIRNFFSVPVRKSLRTSTTAGMTSPAFSIMTVSPIRTSLRAISSSLCKVARATVDPLTRTGSSTATGVNTPVRPTWTRMSRNLVSTRSASYLKAMAQRGDLAVNPSRSRWAKESTFITAPSV